MQTRWENGRIIYTLRFENIKKIDISIGAKSNLSSSSIYYDILCIYCVYIRFRTPSIFYYKIRSSIMTLFFFELNMDKFRTRRLRLL